MAEIPREEKFWMICRKPTHRNSKTEPKARFLHRDAAIDEARRLARQTGSHFTLLESVDEISPTDGHLQSSFF